MNETRLSCRFNLSTFDLEYAVTGNCVMPDLGRDSLLLFAGEIFNLREVETQLGDHESAGLKAEIVASFVKRYGLRALIDTAQGSYLALYIDFENKILEGITDPTGDFYVYWGRSGDELIISTHLTDFESSCFSLNFEWIHSYFAGRDGSIPDTALMGVKRLFPRTILRIENGKLNLDRLGDNTRWMRELYRGPRRNVDVECVVQETANLIGLTLSELGRQHGCLGLAMSQGIDSVFLLSLLLSKGLNFKSYTRMYVEDRCDISWQRHERLMQLLPHDNHIDVIDTRNIFSGLHPEFYHQPDCHYWSSLAVSRWSTVESALQDGQTCLLSGGFGDYLFMHRYRYFILMMLEENQAHPVVQEIRNAILSNQGPAFEKEILAKVTEFLRSQCDFCESSYCFNPKELNMRLLRDFFLKYEGSYIDYFIDTLHIQRGVSHERELSLTSGISVIDPLKDTRLIELIFQLPYQILRNSVMHSIIQDRVISMRTPGRAYVGKNENYAPSEKPYAFPERFGSQLMDAFDLLRDLRVPSLPYYEETYRVSREQGTMNGELCRVLTFYFWYSNWKSRRWMKRSKKNVKSAPWALFRRRLQNFFR